MTALYREKGFMAAKVAPPRTQETPDGLVIVVEVSEGPQARVAAVRFSGATLGEGALLKLTAIQPGTPASDAPLAAAADRIRSEYLRLGFTSARIVPSLVSSGHDFDILFTIDEGEKVLVGSITISGLTRTKSFLVRRQIDLHPGEPLDLRRLGAIERRLLDLGIFDRVLVTASNANPAAVVVDVKEGPVVTAGYDLRWDDVEHGSAVTDAELKNLLGLGVSLGGRYRIGSTVKEIRGSLHASSVGPLGDLTASLFRVQQNFAAVDFFTGETFTNQQVQKGLRLLSVRKLGKNWRLQWGYDRSNITSTVEPTPITESGLNGSAFSETRDNVLDPKSGRFLSLSINYDPRWLGSDFTFLKGLAQVFLIRSVTPSLVWAQGYRVGLARAFGGEVLNSATFAGQTLDTSTSNFQTGGGDSLRGYGTDAVGPMNALGLFVGGDAVVVLNQELRYRHSSGAGAALFYDVGNVFATVHDISWRLRHDVGVGLRYSSPVGLLRLDVAFPLNREPGDKSYRIFFSLGQIF
jgi:translocation and assembly module TamA